MDIKITITSPDLHDAILALAEAINTAGLPWGNPAAKPQPVAPQPVAPPAPQPVAPPAPQPVAPTPVDNWVPQVQYDPVPPPAPEPVAPAPQPVAPHPMTAPAQEYTLQQIAIWAVALQERNLPRLRQILEAFGVQALTQLPKEQYPAFVEALAAEGVTTHAR